MGYQQQDRFSTADPAFHLFLHSFKLRIIFTILSDWVNNSWDREVRKVKLGGFFPATRLLSSKTTGEAKKDERLEDNPKTQFLAPYLFLFWTLCSSFQTMVSRGPWHSPTADSV